MTLVLTALRQRRSRTVGQAVYYTLANGAVSAFGAVTAIVLARALEPAAYGAYAFAVAALALGGMFFEFGFFIPASRAAARARHAQRAILGAALIIFLPIAVGFSVVTAVAAPIVQGLFGTPVMHALELAAPFAWSYPMVLVVTQLAQGVGRLHVGATSALLAQVLFLAGVVALVTFGETGTTTAVLVRSAAAAIANAVAVAWLRPRFHHVKWLGRLLAHEARTWGTRVYLGRLASVGTYNMDVLMVGGFASGRDVAVYTLAGSMSYVVLLPAVGLAGAKFRDMAAGQRIDSRVLWASWSVGGVAAMGLSGSAFLLVPRVFGSGYSAAAALVVPLSAAAAIRGVTTVYNSYLSGAGKGHELQSAGLILAGSNVGLNFMLIPPFGAMGAAIASMLALVANLLAHVHYYRRTSLAGAVT